MNTEAILKHIAQYIALTPAEEDLLLSQANYRRYSKGQYIVQQGDVCRFESFVLKGCLKTYHLDENGSEHILMFAVENWWTADLGSFITGEPASFNVKCLETTEVLQYTREALEKLYAEIPMLERYFRIIVQKAFVASQSRIIRNFSLTARERYLQFRKQYPHLEERVPQYMVAQYLGITKEFLSKIKSNLAIS